MVKGGMTCVKYLMFLFNFVFVLCGIALIVIGGLIFSKYYTVFVDKAFLSGPVIIMAVGFIIFVIAFFGCCGAIKENLCMVNTFGALLFIIIVAEIAGAGAAYIYRARLEDFLEEKLNATLTGGRKEAEAAWAYMQKNLECCGIKGPQDYAFNKTYIPPSCCKSEETECSESTAYTQGCFTLLTKLLKDNIYIVGSVALAVAGIELLGIIFACCLTSAIKKNERGGN